MKKKAKQNKKAGSFRGLLERTGVIKGQIESPAALSKLLPTKPTSTLDILNKTYQDAEGYYIGTFKPLPIGLEDEPQQLEKLIIFYRQVLNKNVEAPQAEQAPA